MSELVIEVTQAKYDDDRYKFLASQAIQVFENTRTKEAHKKMLDVIGGLCRQAYLKGRNDMKRELNG